MLATHVVRDMEGVCLISERHKAFCEPRGVHRYFLRHVASNFNTQFKSVRLKDMCYMTRQILTVRNFEGHRYGVMTTNISEAISGVLKGARRIPITVIVSATFTR
ncbi:hypothetical protein ACS0TY_019937 [Phlomoides rotata]